jgi:hypothetical protein
MDLEALRQLGQARLGRLAPCFGDQADDVGLLGEAPVRVERRDGVQLSACGTDRALEVGGLRIQDTVELTPQGTRHLPGLDLEERARRSDPPEEGPDGFPVLRCHDAATATDAPRDRQTELGQARDELGCGGRLDDELEVCSAAGQA